MILVIDNYDSFTYNLVQQMGELGADLRVARNDQITLDEIRAMQPSHIVISPGPGTPDDGGVSLDVIRQLGESTPILGVCLGHQCIGQAYGGRVVRAERLMHGKTSMIYHSGDPLFANIPSPFEATRYHSLIVQEPLPDALTVTAFTLEGEVMALRHKQFPVVGVQFHPESILTRCGPQILHNFLENLTEQEVQAMTVDIQRAIDILSRFGHLQAQEAESVMNQIMTGGATEAQIGAYLMALRMKGETQDEITGSARAMRANAVHVPTNVNGDLLDTCGTGGDKSGTFNVSTTVAFVVAGAGLPVAKHGNRAATSQCGSADVLAELGVSLELTPEQVGRCIDEIGIGFLFAPMLHPAMKYAIGPRRQIGVRTIFNILGPLTNPAGAQRQIMGVFASDLTDMLAHVLGDLGTKSAMVVNGYGGLDELTTTGPNKISHYQDGTVKAYELDPTELGFKGAHISELLGGDAGTNAAFLRGVLSGEIQDAKRDITLLNAAAALVVGGLVDDMADGVELARQIIDSGAALAKLDALIHYSQEIAL
jgi:anthranilate synthase/phosphoribosyltransferase